MDRKAHWEAVYTSKATVDLSWYQQRPEVSLRLLTEVGAATDSSIIDVGGGDSTLVDILLDRQHQYLTVLDLSGAALARARARLGPRANKVNWLEVDITRTVLPENAYDFWHDRAVFHFLTTAEDRRRYVDAAASSVRPDGALIIATFAPNGPTRCSGLDARRYSAASLADELGDAFALQRSIVEVHRTPSGVEQPFTYATFRRCCKGPFSSVG